MFCLGLLVPGLLMAVGLRSGTIENRPLAKAPPLTAGGLLDPAWYSAVDRFLVDNEIIRPAAVLVRGEAWWLLGGTGNPAVVKGVGSWLFTISEIKPPCDLDAAGIASALDRTRAAFAGAGRDFRFLVAPDKHAVYPDRLDPGMSYLPPCTDARRAAMRAALASRSGFAVDGWGAVLGELAARPDGPPLYYTQDSHWTPTGALPAIRALIRSLGPDLWRDDDVAHGPPRRDAMELARQIGIRRGETVANPIVRPSVHVAHETVALPFRTTSAPSVERLTATGDRPLVPGRTVIVYDSFFGRNIELVAPFFAQSIWIHVGDLESHPEIARLIGPYDRVILERVERGLYVGPIDRLLAPLVSGGG